jgi:hypothetical protein
MAQYKFFLVTMSELLNVSLSPFAADLKSITAVASKNES